MSGSRSGLDSRTLEALLLVEKRRVDELERVVCGLRAEIVVLRALVDAGRA